jgi:tRNA A37 N6-isopentenylltransferase MiaA
VSKSRETAIVTGNRTERKEALKESVDKYLEAIETQIGDIKQVGRNALVIGGVVVAAYALTQLLLPAENSEEEALPINNRHEDEGDSLIWAAVKGAATTLLLTLAKEKLMDLIEHLTQSDAEVSS